MKYDTADDRLIRVGDAYRYWKDRAVTMTDNENARIFRMMMDEVPAAKYEKGKWIYDKYYAVHVCSECDEQALEEYTVNPSTLDRDYDEVLSNYCPNCGARMEVDMEEEDDEDD